MKKGKRRRMFEDWTVRRELVIKIGKIKYETSAGFF